MKSDLELVEKSRSGSREAFDQLMVRYQQVVYRIAYSFTGEKEEALDLCQEAFLLAHQKLDRLTDAQKFRPWLVRLTYNRCLNWRQGQVVMLELSDQDEIPEANLIHPEQQHFLGRCISLLNPKQKLAIVLKYLEGYSYREMGEMMEMSEETAKNLIYRSIQKMARFANS